MNFRGERSDPLDSAIDDYLRRKARRDVKLNIVNINTIAVLRRRDAGSENCTYVNKRWQNIVQIIISTESKAPKYTDFKYLTDSDADKYDIDYYQSGTGLGMKWEPIQNALLAIVFDHMDDYYGYIDMPPEKYEEGTKLGKILVTRMGPGGRTLPYF